MNQHPGLMTLALCFASLLATPAVAGVCAIWDDPPTCTRVRVSAPAP